MEDKKILFVSRGLGLGGAQKMLVYVANICADAGYQVSLISLKNQNTSLLLDDRIAVTKLNFLASDDNKHSILEKAMILLRLRQHIKKVSPDLLVVFMSDIVRITVMSSLFIKIPIVASERADPFQYSPKLFNKYIKSYNKCNAVVFQTVRAMEQYPNQVQAKALVISNPYLPKRVDIQPYSGTRQPLIISAGRLNRQKRFDVLIEAFALVHKKHPEFRLGIYGSGPLQAELHALIGNLGLQNSASLLGESNDLFTEAFDASMFVLSSDFEGVPNVLIEAMGVGMPCIATDCEPGGPHMLFDNERCGLLVPIRDPGKMAEAICQYIEMPALAEQKGSNAVSIRERFSSSIISDQWLKLIETTINS